MNNDIFDDLMDDEITKESLREDINEYENEGQLAMYVGFAAIFTSALIPIFGYSGVYFSEISQIEFVVITILSLGLFNFGLFLLLGTMLVGGLARDNRFMMYRLQMMYENDSQTTERDEL